ncbi:MAG: DUF802 domain-containing protein [Polaromonas sp.]|nr:DUF802 domain-containing protein [Polaromonas sp.]
MNRIVFATAFAIGLLTVGWVGWGFAGASWLALSMTVAIGAVYVLGAAEVSRFRAATSALDRALADLTTPNAAPGRDLGTWLERLPAGLRNPVRLRIEGERVALPGLALAPYLTGLLVMLGMLGTFLGLVVTFKGAVFALEGSTDLQAIRAALAAPLMGLGLSFGTSVAGVATSAMLGLLSAIARRERQRSVRQLDVLAATVFRPLSLAHQRQEAFKAMQAQADALPALTTRLQALMDGLERRSEQLNTQLAGQQERFHAGVTTVYTDLARTVSASLSDSLAAGALAAGQSIRPVVESAMADMADESTRLHQRVFDATQAQLDGLTRELATTARTAGDGWTAALLQHARSHETQVDRLGQALAGFTGTFEQRSAALLATVRDAAADAQLQQASADQQRLAAWTAALQGTAQTLQDDWRDVGTRVLADQQAAALTLARTAADITGRASQQAAKTLEDVAGLVARSEALVGTRLDNETAWAGQQGERMDQLAALWRTELGALRQEEAARGQAAVDRLGELQAALASHLATLGTALEAPMTRLMQTAADVPQAAAGVITQLREEMTRLSERDNLAFEERSSLLEKIGTLLQNLSHASGEQRTAIESLVSAATTVLERAGADYSSTLQTQAGHAADVATHLAGSAIELASLGESFNHGVQLFSATNDKLVGSLQRMESTIGQSVARSDEQLAYYVAQAREVIDLSISSQHALVEDLRRRDAKKPAAARERVE